jgi:hypothetical protein
MRKTPRPSLDERFRWKEEETSEDFDYEEESGEGVNGEEEDAD